MNSEKIQNFNFFQFLLTSKLDRVCNLSLVNINILRLSFCQTEEIDIFLDTKLVRGHLNCQEWKN